MVSWKMSRAWYDLCWMTKAYWSPVSCVLASLLIYCTSMLRGTVSGLHLLAAYFGVYLWVAIIYVLTEALVRRGRLSHAQAAWLGIPAAVAGVMVAIYLLACSMPPLLPQVSH